METQEYYNVFVNVRPCNINRGAEARTCIFNSEASVYIFFSKEQRAKFR